MSDINFEFGITDDGSVDRHASKVKKLYGDVAGSLESLSKLVSEFGKLDTAGNLKTSLASLKTTVVSLSGSFRELGEVAGAGGKTAGSAFSSGVAAGTDAAVRSVRSARKEVQDAYEKMSQDVAKFNGQIKVGALENFKSQGATLFKGDAARLAEYRTTFAAAADKFDAARVGWIAKMQAGSLKIVEATDAAAARESAAQLAWAAKMQVGSLKIAESTEAAAARETAARVGWIAKMQAGSLKIQEAIDADAERTLLSRLAWSAKLQRGTKEFESATEAAKLRESASQASWIAKMQVGSLKIAEAANEATSREEAAKAAWTAKMQVGSLKIANSMEESAKREDAARVAWIAKMQVGSLKIVDEITKSADREAKATSMALMKNRDLNAQFEAMTPQGQLARAKRVAAIAVDGAGSDYATSRYGSSAVAASEAQALATLSAEVARLAEAKRNLKPASDGVAEGAKRGNEANKALKESTAALNKEMRDAHSAARGLASGFNAMWLTWGSLAPLLAGAGISNAFVQTAKVGADVEQSLTAMRVLGGETAQAVAGLNAQMLDLAKSGPFGPRETADAMKTLTLAGLSATEVSSSLRDVLNFSIAGDTGIKEAADTLTTVATAFGVSADRYFYVSDIISKSAAESKASVADMSNAFKTASAINQQFGVSLEDTAVNLALLANAGIKGTAAGTSLRNMVSDLSGRTKHAQAALRELGVDAIDPTTGKVKNLDLVMTTLLDKLQKTSTPAGALKYLQTIFDERGAKDAYAVFEALQKKAAETSDTVQNKYQELKESVINAAGFAAIAAAEMSLTPLNQMKSVSATLQAALVETFNSLRPYILQVSTQLKDLFNSEEFKSGMQSLVVGFSEVIATVLRYGKVIAEVALAGYAFSKIATIVLEVRTAFLLLTAASTGTAAAVAGVGVASRLAMAANPLLLALSAAIALAAAGWALYEVNFGRASKVVDDGKAGQEALIKSLEVERDRLVDINEAKRQNITLDELKSRREGVKAESSMQPEIDRVRKQLEDAKLVDKPRAVALDAQLTKLMREQNGLREQRIRLEYQIRKETELAERDERARIEEQMKSRGAKFTGMSAGPADVANSKAGGFKVEADNIIAETNKRNSIQLELSKHMLDNEMKLIKAQAQSVLEFKGQALYAEFQLIQSSESEKLSTLAEGDRLAKDAFAKRLSELNEGYVATVKTESGKKGWAEKLIEVNKQYDAAVRNLTQSEITREKQYDANVEKAKNDTITERARLLLEISNAMRTAQKAYDDFNKSEADNLAKQGRQDSLNDQLRFASPEARAYLQATAAEYERLTSTVLNYDKAIEEAQRVYDGMLAKARENGPVDEENDPVLKAQKALVDLNKQLRQGIADSIDPKSNAAGQRAVTNLAEDTAKKLQDDISGALVTALFEGGQEGATALRNIIVAELKKPVTVFVQAMVSSIANGVVGGAASSATNSALGSAFGTTAGASALGSQFGTGFSGTVSGWFGSGSSSAIAADGSMAAGASADAYAAAAANGGTTSMATSIGSYMPYVLAAVVAYNLLKGGEYVQSTGFADRTYSTAGKGANLYNEAWKGTAVYEMSNIDYGGGFNPKNMTRTPEATQFADNLAAQYFSYAKILGIALKDTHFGFSANSDNKGVILGGAVGGKQFQSKEFGLQDNAAISNASARAVFTALLESDLPKYLKGAFDGMVPENMTSDQISTALEQAKAVASFHDQLLLLPFEGLKDMSFEATVAMLRLNGGMDTFTANLKTYYDNFYNADEKRATTVGNIVSSLSKAGGNVTAADFATGGKLDTRAEWRTLVETTLADLGPDSPLYAALLANSGAFADITPAAKDAARTLDQVATNLTSLKDTGAQLAIDLQAITDPTGAAAAQRTLDTKGLTPAEIVQYDTNADTRTKIETAKTLAGWTDKLASLAASASPVLQRAYDKQKDLIGITDKATIGKINDYYAQLTSNDIAAQTLSTKEKIDILTGKTTQTEIDRARILTELDALDPSGVLSQLTKDMWNLEDAAAAAASSAKNLNDKLSIQAQIYKLTNDSAGSASVLQQQRNIQINDLLKQDPSGGLARLTLTMWDLQDAATAAEESTKALSAAESAQSKYQSAMDKARGIQDQATSAYLAAQDKVAAAQQAIADAALAAAHKMDDLGTSLQEFVDKQMGVTRGGSNFNAIARAAQGGDVTALSKLAEVAQTEIDKAKNTSGSYEEFTARRAAILSQVQKAATLAKERAAPELAKELSPEAKRSADLLAAQKEMTEALRVANAIGAPLTKSVEDLISKYNEALGEANQAKADAFAATKTLNDIQKNTLDTAKNVDALKLKLQTELTVKGTEEIAKLVRLTVNTDGLDAGSKDLLTGVAKSATLIIGMKLDGTPETLDALNSAKAATTAGTKVVTLALESDVTKATLDTIAGAVDQGNKNITLSLTGSAEFALAVSGLTLDGNKNIALSLLPENETFLAGVTKATAEINKIVSLALKDFEPGDAAVLLAAATGVTKTITAALGASDAAALAVAVTQTETITKTLRASGGVLTDDQRALINGITLYNKEIWLTVKLDEEGLTQTQAALKAAFGTIDLGTIGTGNAGGVIGQTAAERLASIKTYVETLDWGTVDSQDASSRALAPVAKQYGVTMLDLANAMGQGYEAVVAMFAHAGIPKFAVGTNFVPNDMFAQIHKGEAIIPAAFNPERYSRASGNDALVMEIKALREEVSFLRSEQRAGHGAIASNTRKTHVILSDITQGGSTMQVEGTSTATVLGL